MKSGSVIIGALKQLLVAANETSERQMTMLASFVCDAYCPNGIAIRRVFCKQMTESNRLPSTSGTRTQDILRVHVQARICDNRTLSPLQNGFCKDANGDLVSHTTEDLPAPKAIIEMVNCQSKGCCSSQRYDCRAHHLVCIELCLCSTKCQKDDYYNCNTLLFLISALIIYG